MSSALDLLSWVCLVLGSGFGVAFVGAIIVAFSFGYISHYENRNEYYFMVVLFLGSMMGLVFSASLILMYLFVMITILKSNN